MNGARPAGVQARRSPLGRWLVTTGLVAYGLVHLLIGWVAGQLAWGRSDEEASQRGALQELADKPLGGVLLWVVAIGLFALVLWQTLEAAAGHRALHGARRAAKRLSSVARAVVYLALGISAATTAAGSSSGGSGEEQGVTARLLAEPFGRVLVTAAGLIIIAVGVYHVYKAFTANFTYDLAPDVPPATVTLGRVGYAAKGVALSIAGALVGWAAVGYDPDKAGGLDTALRTVRDQPAGPVLLTLIAAGIACFGIYCFVWSRHAEH